ncbi:MAG TPA: ribose-phosphate diphosphokinase [Thermoprotei archaeon]|nr:ribose-phosphate diphosphokinase [Thermoprotei archaeon]
MIVAAPDYAKDNAVRLASNLGCNYTLISTRYFPNGEVLARVNEVEKLRDVDRIILFFPTYPNTNDRILMLFESLEAIRHYIPGSKLELVIPYFSYSRQDKRFLDGEALTLKLIIDFISVFDISRIYIFDIHSLESFKKYAKKLDYIHISLLHKLFEYIKNIHEIDNAILVAPDEGRLNTVSDIAEKHSLDYTYLIKERDRYTGKVTMKPGEEIDFSKYNSAIILDDEISTGGTMALASSYLKKNGVDTIIAAASHLLLISGADKKLFNSGVDFLYGSNTILNPYAVLYIEDILPEYIKD